MKKKLSIILLVIMLITFLSVPAFAANEPDSDLRQAIEDITKKQEQIIRDKAEEVKREITDLTEKAEDNSATHAQLDLDAELPEERVHKLQDVNAIDIRDDDVYIISSGSHVLTDCFVDSGTLVIEKDARVAVLGDASVGKEGTLIVLGTIEFYTNDEPAFYGQVYVDGGIIGGDYSVPNGVINSHIIKDGVCVICGLEMGIQSPGSTLSGGNIAIITAVAGIAFGLVCGLLIGKKKKKLATAGGAEKEIKDEE